MHVVAHLRTFRRIEGAAGEQRADERGQRTPRVLARSVRIEDAPPREAGFAGACELRADKAHRELRGGVERRRFRRTVFAQPFGSLGVVLRAGAGHHDRAATRREHPAQQGDACLERFQVFLGVKIKAGYGIPGKVNTSFGSGLGDHAIERGRVPEIAGGEVRINALQPVEAVSRERKRGHLVSAHNELPCDSRSDEPGGAGDEHPHAEKSA
jgi:hypothetical protein